MRIRDRRGRTTRVTDRRLVHMAEPHLAALELVIEAEDWSGPIEVRSVLDAVEVSAARCDIAAMRIAIRGTVHELSAGERRTFPVHAGR